MRLGLSSDVRNCCFAKENIPYLISDEVDLVTHIQYSFRGAELLDQEVTESDNSAHLIRIRKDCIPLFTMTLWDLTRPERLTERSRSRS